jgi:hypothetical protein
MHTRWIRWVAVAGCLFMAPCAVSGQAPEASTQRPGNVVRDGLMLDLDADHGVGLENGNRVWKWENRLAGAEAAVFIKRNKGRSPPGSGRPRLKRSLDALAGHNTIVFHRQELINHNEDAFDHLTTGSGYTWFSVMAVFEQVPGVKDVNSFFGNLRNGGHYEGFWAGLNDDNTLWMGTRNGLSFGRWDKNNPKVTGPRLKKGRYYVVVGRMQSGTGEARLDLFVNKPKPTASATVPINPDADASRMAIGQERDAVNHPGKESFDGAIARFLVYERPLTDREVARMLHVLKAKYQIEAD